MSSRKGEEDSFDAWCEEDSFSKMQLDNFKSNVTFNEMARGNMSSLPSKQSVKSPISSFH